MTAKDARFVIRGSRFIAAMETDIAEREQRGLRVDDDLRRLLADARNRVAFVVNGELFDMVQQEKAQK